MYIDRILFWFQDGDESLLNLHERFFGLATLMNRLLNETYKGKKIKFINIEFNTEKTYDLYPHLAKETPYYYGGHLKYYGTFDRGEFENLHPLEKDVFVWNKGIEYLKKAADFLNNEKLKEAIDYCYKKGAELKLNPNFRVVESEMVVMGQQFKAAVWIIFEEDFMYSKFTLEKSNGIVFEKEIDRTKNGVEFFLEIYKAIDKDENNIIIKGRKDVPYLPLKIPLNQLVLCSINK